MTLLSMGGTNPASKKPSNANEPKTPRPAKPIHPGLDLSTHRDHAWCRKCHAPIEFREVWGNALRLGICNCGLWIRDRRDFVRFLRFDTDSYMIGHEGPMFYQREREEKAT